MKKVILTSVAGLATGIGAFMVMLAKKVNPRFLSLSMGLSCIASGIRLSVVAKDSYNEIVF